MISRLLSPLSCASRQILTCGLVVAHPRYRDDVERAVGIPISTAAEPMPACSSSTTPAGELPALVNDSESTDTIVRSVMVASFIHGPRSTPRWGRLIRVR